MNQSHEKILNVTLIEPKLKHPTIFARFDSLGEGDNIVILNDHDPKPLYYQLLGERGSTFSWEYLEQGPVWWKVKICKRTTTPFGNTLGEIATKDINKARIFKKYGLDFCCGGKKTVNEACREVGVDPSVVERELQEFGEATFYQSPLPYDEWSLTFLTDFILNTHHAFIRKLLPDILAYSLKVNSVHGDIHPELVQINQLVNAISDELNDHMVKEEKLLFPYIKDLELAKQQYLQLARPSFGTIRNPIHMMELEHESVGMALSELRKVTSNYSPPDDACASYTQFFRFLESFEDDLHLHIHLENNILFPRAILMEQELSASTV